MRCVWWGVSRRGGVQANTRCQEGGEPRSRKRAQKPRAFAREPRNRCSRRVVCSSCREGMEGSEEFQPDARRALPALPRVARAARLFLRYSALSDPPSAWSLSADGTEMNPVQESGAMRVANQRSQRPVVRPRFAQRTSIARVRPLPARRRSSTRVRMVLRGEQERASCRAAAAW